MTRTKIVCTIGPASSAPEVLQRLIDAGMDVARLNFSHGDHDEHGRVAAEIRRLAQRAGRPVAILQDLSGAKLRTGPLANGPVTLEPGADFTLTRREVPGDVREVSLGYPELVDDVQAGDRVLLGDGALELLVEAVSGDDIRTRVVAGGELGARKGIHLPGRTVRAPSLTDKDREDLAFGLEIGVDLVAQSFVRRAADVRAARQFMEERGQRVPLIAKIEKHEALECIDEILDLADGIMIARGDLGMEIPIEQVPLVQKTLIERANRAAKPVITATQMLRSMVESPRPTRAEVTDVANAILDGTDAVMLSEETAVGKHVTEAVGMMARVAADAEKAFPFDAWTIKFGQFPSLGLQEAVARGACQMAETLDAAAILTFTQSGSTTRMVAKYRPRQPILAATPDEATYRRLALVWGAVPLWMEPADSQDDLESAALKLVVELGLVEPGRTVVFTAGVPLRMPGTTNLIKVVATPTA